MTQVFFYHGASDKIAAACALIQGAWKQRKPLVVYAPEKSQSDSVDRILWTRDPLSFIPHCRADAPLAAETPILIAEHLDNTDLLAAHERLMNLSNQLPPGYHNFGRLIEVVSQDEEERQAARRRVHHYKEQGCEVQFFDLSNR
ncbi:MAG: DNA polymerase III subunit chi [Azonexus sp.]|nr:DNA polymerase III subunit chi [Azonexus sp.]